MVPAGARAQPALLRPLGAGREEARMKRLLLVAASSRSPAPRPPRPIRSATSRSTTSPGSQVSGHRIYVRYVARHGRDPDVPEGAAPTTYAAVAAAARRPATAGPLRSCRRARARASRSAPAACTRRASRSILARPARSRHAHGRLPRQQLPRPDRLEGGRRRRAHRLSTSDELRAYPKDLLSSPLDVHSADRDARADAATRRRRCSRGKALQRAGPRSPTPASRALIGRGHLSLARHPRVARRRALLGRGARALAGPRQDDRHRLPRRPARHAAARGAARADRDGHAHDRRLRARRS